MGIDLNFRWTERIRKFERGRLITIGHTNKEFYIGGGMGTSQVLRDILARCIHSNLIEYGEEVYDDGEYYTTTKYLNRNLYRVNVRPVDLINALREVPFRDDDNNFYLTPQESGISNYLSVMYRLQRLFDALPYYLYYKYISVEIMD